MKESNKKCCDSAYIDCNLKSNTTNLPILNRMLRNRNIKTHSGKEEFKKNQTKKVTFSKHISNNNDISETDDKNKLNKLLSSPTMTNDMINSVSYNKQTEQELSWLKKTPNAETNNNNNNKIFDLRNSQINDELSRKKDSNLKI